jgi:uncharacterized protein (DUF924 family)
MESAASICEYWFGRGENDLQVAREKSSLWWSKNESVDVEIAARFEETLRACEEGNLDHWSGKPQGLLALILLVDQFPRNIYRETPQSFAYDVLALKWCNLGLSGGLFERLRPIEQVFCYLPLEHSESLADQQKSVELYQALMERVSAEMRESFAGYVDFAKKHLAIVERFGRFPHRNKILGRPSTEEEITFLNEPGSSF